jgi:ATP-dependent DNA helicase RecQ
LTLTEGIPENRYRMQKEQGLFLLRQMLGAQAEFREGQWEAIDAAANRRERLLVVQRTGWGKSIVYFLAAKILRDAGAGPSLLVSPLLSLMRNQLLAAEKIGIRAETMHSENLEEWAQVEAGLKEGQIDLLMVSPERLGNAEFLQRVLPTVEGNLGMFVVDEAHCISDWGHDFRPDYRRIVRVLKLLPPGLPVLCTTATANNRVVRDIESQIPNLRVMRGPLVRPSLKLYNLKLDSQAERLAWLAHFLPQIPGNGIIYTLTIQDARRVAAWLQRNHINARAYHSDLGAAERVETERQLLKNEVKALVATVALGMGFDKPDLGFVIHFQRPGSVVAYYQQVGRAGRAVDSAFGILLSGLEDDEIQDYFIRTAFPPVEVLLNVLKALERAVGLRIDQIGAELNYSRGAIEKALKLLEVDGALRHEGSVYSRTVNRWAPDLSRFEEVTRHRREELAQIKTYVEHNGCLMEFLAKVLDDPSAGLCGKCMNCTGNKTRRPPPREQVVQAVEFLRGDALVLEPRGRWPAPVLKALQHALPAAVECTEAGRVKTTIPADRTLQPGRALCIWGDSGWGSEVARGKYETGRFSDALVEAAARLIRERWNPVPPPQWVAAVPSNRRPDLIRGFAQRLAAQLGVTFYDILRKTRETAPQKQMENSVHQVVNLLGAFTIEGKMPYGPVLLIDDVIDSGWTLCLLGVMLQAHGSGPVFPLALAKASPRGG